MLIHVLVFIRIAVFSGKYSSMAYDAVDTHDDGGAVTLNTEKEHVLPGPTAV